MQNGKNKILGIFLLVSCLGCVIIGSNITKNMNNYSLDVENLIHSSNNEPPLYEWDVEWGNEWSYLETASGVATDSKNNIYMVVDSQTFGSGQEDIVIIKYDGQGNQMWIQSWGGTGIDSGQDCIVDINDNLYVCGYTRSFGNGLQACLIKYSSSGEEIWNLTWGGSADESVSKIAIDSMGFIYLTGYTESYSSSYGDIFLAQFDVDGNLYWYQTWNGGNFAMGNGLAIDSTDNILITGSRQSHLGAQYNVVVLKYNRMGNLQWYNEWGGSSSDFGHGIAVDSNGDVYVTGRTQSYGIGFTSIFLIKYDSSGSIQWDRIWDGTNVDYGYDIIIDSFDNIFITGQTNSDGVGGFDMILLNYNVSGNIVWKYFWGTSSDDTANSITQDSLGNFYLAGSTGGWSSTTALLVKLDNAIPYIDIISPQEGHYVGSSSPQYNISIFEGHLDNFWYTLDDGLNNISITTLEGVIDQTEWDKIENGPATLTFFANDTNGNLNSREVNVFKDLIAPNTSISFVPYQGIDIVNKSTVFTFEADDGNGSGPVVTKYRTRNLGWREYTGPITLDHHGLFEVLFSFYTIDAVGNSEETKTKTLQLVDIERPPPDPFEPRLERYKIINNTDYDYFESMTIDSVDNTYLAGYSKNLTSGTYDGIILKIDIFGNTLWNLSWPSSGYIDNILLAIDSMDYLYIAGHNSQSGSGRTNVILAKYDSSGSQIWNRTWTGPYDDHCYSMKIDESDNIYLVGDTGIYFYTYYSHMLLIKYDSSGNQLWNTTWGGWGYGGDIAYELALDSLNNIYISGLTASYDIGSNDIATIKFDSSGIQLWNRTWGGSSTEYFGDIKCDSADSVYIIGETYSFDIGRGDLCLIKYDASGLQLWNRTWGGVYREIALGIQFDSSDNVYIAGESSSFNEWRNDDIILVKYDTFGSQLWNRTWGGGSGDSLYDFVKDEEDTFYIVGDTSNFGSGSNDFFVVRYDEQGYLLYEKIWGGIYRDVGMSLSFDSNKNLYVAGISGSFSDGVYDFCLLKYDNSAPIININSPMSGDPYGIHTPSYNLSIIEGSLENMWYTLDNGATNFTFTDLIGEIDQTEWNNIIQGPVIIRFYVRDELGYETYAEISIVKDIQEPEILILSPEESDAFAGSSPGFEIFVVEDNIDSTWYTLDNGLTNYTFIGFTGTVDQVQWSSLADGQYDLTIFINDTSSNQNSARVTIFKDTILPFIEINNPLMGDLFAEVSPRFDISVIDNHLQSLWYTLDDGVTNISFTSPIAYVDQDIWYNTPNGVINLIFFAKDAAGNINQAGVSITKDFIGMIDVDLVEEFLNGDEFNFTFYVCKMAGGPIETAIWTVLWNGFDYSSFVQNLGGGYYFISVPAIMVDLGEDPIILDIEINALNHANKNIQLNLAVSPPNLVPIPDYTTDLTEVYTDDIVIFTFTGYQGDYPAEFYWDFGDGDTSTEMHPEHSYSSTGVYNITLTIIDASGDFDLITKISLITVLNTPIGTDVEVLDESTGVNIIFGEITGNGTTTVEISVDEPDPPEGFEVAGEYYNISSDASFSGLINVSIPYNESEIMIAEENLRMYHWEEIGGWIDVTTYVDTINNIIHGQVTEFSIFIVFEINYEELKSFTLGEIEQLLWKVMKVSNDCWENSSKVETMCEEALELQSLLEFDSLGEGYDKLLYDIKPKLTGLKTDENEIPWDGGTYNDPWIICEDKQIEFRDLCNQILKKLVILSEANPYFEQFETQIEIQLAISGGLELAAIILATLGIISLIGILTPKKKMI